MLWTDAKGSNKNEEIRGRMSITTSIMDVVEAKSLRWYGHLCRMKERKMGKNTFKPERRKRARSRASWRIAVIIFKFCLQSYCQIIADVSNIPEYRAFTVISILLEACRKINV